MRVIVNDKMKEWVSEYIRAHRKETCISIHVVFSKFNEDFKAMFKIDPRTAISLMIAEGFLKGSQAKGGYSIWLPEDVGKGQFRSFRPRPETEVVATAVEAEVQKVEQSVTTTAQTGESKMKMIEDVVVPVNAFELLPHPETGEVDILKLVGYLAQKLGTKFPTKPKTDAAYRVGKLGLFPALVEIGIPREKCADISRILQEMALIRKYPKSQWGIIHHSAIVYFLTPSLYNIAREAMAWRDERNNEIATLRQKMAALTGVRADEPKQVPSPSPLSLSSEVAGSFEDEAIEALAEAERLSEDLALVNAKLAEVEAERDNVTLERDKLNLQLQDPPAAAEIVKQAFKERLQAIKMARA